MKRGFSFLIQGHNQQLDISFNNEEFDNLYIDNAEILIIFEGVLLNRKQLINMYAAKSYAYLIQELFKNKKDAFLSELEGEFRGMIWDKINQKIYAFTNATSTKQLFYYHKDGILLVDTGLQSIFKNLQQLGENPKIDIESMYQLLAFTNLIENKTPLENVKKIYDAHCIIFDIQEQELFEKQYYNVESESFSGTYEQALKRNHEIFSEAVALEYQKDDALEKRHFALLSGGLDSRVALLYADKLGEKPQDAFCFSQSGYLDETISRKIAKDYQYNYIFKELDGGDYLKNIDRLMSFSEGMVLYTGSIHVDYAINQSKINNPGMIHSGQIGDGILGGFNSVPKLKKPDYYKILVNPKFLSNVEESLKASIEKYDREEVFLLRNIAFNRTVLGTKVWEQISHQTSPFMHKDFMNFALSLPENWKFKHRFYIDWIKKYSPESTQYTWERTLLKPNAKWKTYFGDQFLKRAQNAVYNKLLNLEQKISMYPYQFYFNNNTSLQEVYQSYFADNVSRLDGFPDLKKDVETLFSEKDFFSKSSAINILAVFKYFSIG
ncbi:asparagine synthase-related protein [Soonwooa sp.]|uniref:asparagine synthase-related protein n=1 Tax=Soonwooa sp. TaxID=1938592 RepID=UPI002633C861|nr:asparagine synthase-related protein [Soonwooa sp.]